MSTSIVTVEPDTHLQRVLELMIRHRLKSLPVVDQWKNLLGIIAREDIMRAMARSVPLQFPAAVPSATA
jgi:CBS-domain-containing membrane protein